MGLITAWPRSLERWHRSSKVLAGGVSTGLRAQMVPHPISFERGSGSQVWDIDGNRYTDYVMGWGPLFLGHTHPGVVEAVQRQVGLGQTFGSGHHREYEVAEDVLAAMPWFDRVIWSNTGTEAVQSALRIARAWTGRQQVVKFAGHYHGWMDNVLVNYRGEGADRIDRPVRGSDGQSPTAMSETRVARWNDLASVTRLLSDRGNRVAAVILEPVVANTGVIPPAPGFLAELRQACDRTGTVLIFDEVITGFRLAPGGASDVYGVRPDLSVLAKSIASGFSLAAVVGRGELLDQVSHGVVHAGTYNGNPIALAAAGATLTELRRTTPQTGLTEVAERLASGLQASIDAVGLVGSAHAVGPIVQVAFGVNGVTDVASYLAADWARYDAFTLEMLRRGQFLLPGGRWYLSAAHTADEVDASLDAAAESLTAVARAAATP